MTIDEEIAQRHLLAVDGFEERCCSPNSTAVRSDSSFGTRWASSKSGQVTDLLPSQFAMPTSQIGTSYRGRLAPETRDPLIRMPNGDNSSNNFPDCLQALATWAVEHAIAVSTVRTGTVSADHTIFVGEIQPELNPNTGDRNPLVAIGDGWRAWVGDTPANSKELRSPSFANPLGPFLAAALVAGEIFKRGRGILRGQFLSSAGYSLWSGATSPDWDALEDGPSIAGTVLPPVHVVEPVQSATRSPTLANLGLTDGYIILVDDDKYDWNQSKSLPPRRLERFWS